MTHCHHHIGPRSNPHRMRSRRQAQVNHLTPHHHRATCCGCPRASPQRVDVSSTTMLLFFFLHRILCEIHFYNKNYIQEKLINAYFLLKDECRKKSVAPLNQCVMWRFLFVQNKKKNEFIAPRDTRAQMRTVHSRINVIYFLKLKKNIVRGEFFASKLL